MCTIYECVNHLYYALIKMSCSGLQVSACTIFTQAGV